MGQIYLAEDTTLGRRVALKILPDNYTSDPDRLQRFVREARAASALNHPNILTVYEIGEIEGCNFIATEFVQGRTLRQRIEKRDLELDDVLSIARQAAEALAAAHAAGIVHRDIKPENIMVRDDGYVKVLDFGLAKLTEVASNYQDAKEASTRQLALTDPGMIMGTVLYMSPEQTRGMGDIDGRADIWSLGVVTFEMLSGRRPFTGETTSDIIASILKTEAPHLSEWIACPPELDRIIAKTLKKKREERYQGIKDLAIDLRSLRRDLDMSHSLSRPGTESSRSLVTGTSANPRRGVLAIAIAALMFITAGISGYAFFSGRFSQRAAPAGEVKIVDVASWNSAPGETYSAGRFSPDGRMVAFASTRSGTKNIWVKQAASGEAVQVTKDEFDNEQPIWSPDGEEIAFVSTRGDRPGIWRIPVLGGSARLVANFDDRAIRPLQWSKTGVIYYESNAKVGTVDLTSGRTVVVADLEATAAEADSITISNDEKQLAFTSVDGEVWNVSVTAIPDPQPRKILELATETRNVVWSNDNNGIFFSGLKDGTFQIFHTDSAGATPRQVTVGERDAFALGVSPDGAKILFGSAKEESDIWRVLLADGNESIVTSDIDAELWPNISPDGRSIAYQSIKNLSQGNKLTSGEIYSRQLSATDASPTRLAGSGFMPTWSPSGSLLSFVMLVGDKYMLMTIPAAGGEPRSLASGGIAPPSYSLMPYNRVQTSDFSWSPDSSGIAYVSGGGGVRNIWISAADGTRQTPLTTNSDVDVSFVCPLWSPDGRSIIAQRGDADGNAELAVIDPVSKTMRPIAQGNSYIRLIGWLAGGREVLVATASKLVSIPPETSLMRVDILSGAMKPVTVLRDAYLYNIRLSPDGKNVAYAAHRDGKDNIWVLPAAGGESKKVTNNNDSRLYFSSLTWSPDGSTIYFGKQLRYSLLSMVSNFN
jgi:serine/threonine protein kinase/dipeptidyl aminopeptidase/acylaminoacyl peptidase